MGNTSGDEVWPEGVTPTPTFLALIDHVRRSHDNIFVTGRAGTGKSTLLRAVVKIMDREAVIGAPTGIAALNVGGETLHALFRLPQSVLLDGDEEDASPRPVFDADSVTLIIDEVSMVRSDVMNAMDLALRRKREINRPFGGVRVIAFGDTHQLPPVATPDIDARLREAFGGGCFFNAPGCRSMVVIELQDVFRQKDPAFVALLNEVRDGRVSDAALTAINRRVGPRPVQDAEAWVWLCATNKAAAEINTRFLRSVKGQVKTYNAVLTGEFENRGGNASGFPPEMELTLKEGARVVFIRNDRHRRWVNGTTGVVTSLGDNEIEVTTSAGEEVSVGFETWTKRRRVKVGEEMRDEELGPIFPFSHSRSKPFARPASVSSKARAPGSDGSRSPNAPKSGSLQPFIPKACIRYSSRDHAVSLTRAGAPLVAQRSRGFATSSPLSASAHLDRRPCSRSLRSTSRRSMARSRAS
jgi:ATP-dependent DNA helicase PIF1